MNAVQRSLRRKQLDAQFKSLVSLGQLSTPHGGWIRSIRESLGMNLEHLARRLNLASGSTALQIERAEVNEGLSIKRMRATADALGCDLVIALIPRQPLERTVQEQALRKATEQLARVSHTMEMESQTVGGTEMQELLQRTADDILARGGSRLWE